MSPIEDEIRDTLRSEAARLREMRPLRLPAVAAPREPRAERGPHRARRLRPWLVPAAAAVAVVLVAAVLVILKSLGNEPAAVPAANPSPIAGPPLAPDATPRYYVELSTARSVGARGNWAIIVGDEQARKTIATYLLPAGQVMTNATVSGAADDRTFVVSASVPAKGQLLATPTWYLVRILPGSAEHVRVTRLPIKFPVSSTPNSPESRDVLTSALSGDGTELAVLSANVGTAWKNGQPLTLQVYSVASGLLQHSWSAGIDATQANRKPITDLSWAGDSTVGFAVTYTPQVREEVRTLDVSASGGSLLADSRVVWSQNVPSSPLTPREKATTLPLAPATRACDTPFLTGDGQTVVCGNSTYSASTKRLSAVWLAYPLATPARPRVLARFQEPPDVTAFDGPVSVDWTNASGTEIISSWEPIVITGPADNPVSGGPDDQGYIGHGTIKTFPWIPGSLNLAW